MSPHLLQPEGEDDLKKRQLMELAIINGTYRDTKSSSAGAVANATIAVNRKSACCVGGSVVALFGLSM